MEKGNLSEDENDAKYEGLREFVMETMVKFSNELKEVKVRVETLESEVESGKGVKRKLIEEESEEEEEEEVALSVDDLKEDMREKVEEVLEGITYRPEKEKVSQLQLAYIHYWVGVQETNTPTKLVDIQKLIEEGVRDRIWAPEWKPDIKGDFALYLQEKVKNIVKKKRAQREKARLQKELEELVGDSLK
ncbi:uncharacterized protein LOC134236129 [Saccostrea cucullata]|uniref:uncharacterized protein LOC134236129 n=1 Tax=Saccostrea cuccullata TaxID=36930 RepID=UPI002ED54C92